MKIHFSLLIATLITNTVFSQTANYDMAINAFQANYNAGKFEAIFNSFSPEMQQNLPIENTNQFLAGLKSQVGKIASNEFVKEESGTTAFYKTKFEKAVLATYISLDKQNKISGLLIKPYKEPTENKSVNALQEYPDEIADLIYAKSKDFPNNTQLSIALIQNGKVNYYGIIKENDAIKPIANQNKIFEIGSITKVFTSTLLAGLVTDKKIKLTDDINAFYSFPFQDNTKLSFENLANHTSGLPRLPENLDLSNETNPYKSYGEDELEAYLKNILKLENEASKNYAYSNLGAGLLGFTLGKSQKTSFQELLQKRIFEKYNMTNSFTSSQHLGNRLVGGLDMNGKSISNWDFDALFGGGGILSTTEDLAKFAIAQFNPKNTELELTRQPTFNINENMKIGLGWHLLKNKNGQDLIWHNGGTGGYTSSMAVDVKNKNAVIILSNVSAFNSKTGKIEELCFSLIN